MWRYERGFTRHEPEYRGICGTNERLEAGVRGAMTIFTNSALYAHLVWGDTARSILVVTVGAREL